jgi:alpha-L-fucosidase
MAVATGDASFRENANYMVAELAKCQDALNQGGYLAAFPSGAVNWLEGKPGDGGGVLVPYYTIHKLMAGLLDAHHYLGNTQALEVAVKMAGYFENRLAALKPKEIEKIFRTDGSRNPGNEFGAMSDVLAELYAVTGDRKHLAAAQVFNRPWFIGPLAAGEDRLANLHANTHVAQALGIAHCGNLSGDTNELKASENFWKLVTQRHSFVNGGNSFAEWFDKPGVETGPSIDDHKELPPTTAESCNTHNMLKLTARLFEREPRAEYADYFERALYNHLLATIAPDSGAVTYFTPLRGNFRTYINDTFCCVGSGIENTPRYNEGIYFQRDKSLWVNLYIPSELDWREAGLVVRQEGDVTRGEPVRFTVVKAGKQTSSLNFRIPQWISKPAVLALNGKVKERAGKPSTYVSLKRKWKKGDVITLTLPAALRLEQAKDSPSMVSVLFGPVLLAGELGRENMPNDRADKDAHTKTPAVAVPEIKSASANPADWFEPVTGAPLVFKAHGVGPADGILFRPLYDLHHQRYSVYWRIHKDSKLGATVSGADELAATGSAAAAAEIPYAIMHVIAEGDSDAVIAEKAAKVLPRPNQVAWMRHERTFFLHFGVNTFNEVEWGSGREEPTVFNPTELDANQWMRAITNFGGKMIVLVAKHHDGFCYWPSRYTAHTVAASPWRGGKGDEVREVADAARTHGVKLAVYLSPADLYQLRTNPKNPAGYYGNGSSNLLSVIPTDPASFQSDPSKGRAPTPGFKSYTYVVDDYNRYFLNQLYELLTEYGPIGEVWFDGANPDPSVHETYNYEAWYHLIRSLQPNAVIMGKGPDVRWVGNEGGVGRTTEWSVIPLPTAPAAFRWPDMTAGDLGSRAKLRPGSHLWWYPAEVNTTILERSQWFWARNKRPRTITQLVDIFYTSVGRNGNLILNLSPDKRGLVPDNQLDALSKAAQIINETFATDLARDGKLSADHANATNGAALALDGNLDTWWEAAPGKTNGAVTLTLPKPVTFDVVSLQEAVAQRGQRIESFAIETWNGSEWINAEKIQSDELTTVGHRRIIRLKAPVTTEKVRIRITGARLEPTLAELGLFKQSIATLPPTISDRSTNGAVSLSNLAGNKMVYTIDGSAPTANSPVYTAPIVLPSDRSVTVRAASLLPTGQLGIVGSRIFAGLMPIGWKVIKVDSEETAGADNSAARAIDGDSSTFWHTRWNADQRQPHTITVDMAKTNRIGGFTYLPRQDGLLNGVVERYRFEASADGVTWTTNIADSSFANIQNNPSLQEVIFAPVEARYFRFTSLRAIWNSGWTSAAEISVLPARSGN